MIHPPNGNAAPPQADAVPPPPPHLTGKKYRHTSTVGNPRAGIISSVISMVLFCFAAFCFYQSGTLFRRGFGSPLVVLVPPAIVTISLLAISVRNLRKAQKENADDA